jgi:hypothetical protein
VLKLGKHGGDRRSEKAKAEQGGPSTLKPSEKNTKKHWEMRLADQAPEHLAAFRHGDHKSIKVAARAAAYVATGRHKAGLDFKPG